MYSVAETMEQWYFLYPRITPGVGIKPGYYVARHLGSTAVP